MAAISTAIRMHRAFTLVEVLIVVVILAILAAIVVPAFSNVTRESRQVTFVHDLKIFNHAASVYMAKTNSYPPDSVSGEMPEEMEDYLDSRGWSAITPIGGAWDTEYMTFGIISAIGVHFNGAGETQDDAYMTEIDSRFDDGDLTDGLFRKLDEERYYIVLAE